MRLKEECLPSMTNFTRKDTMLILVTALIMIVQAVTILIDVVLFYLLYTIFLRFPVIFLLTFKQLDVQ